MLTATTWWVNRAVLYTIPCGFAGLTIFRGQRESLLETVIFCGAFFVLAEQFCFSFWLEIKDQVLTFKRGWLPRRYLTVARHEIASISLEPLYPGSDQLSARVLIDKVDGSVVRVNLSSFRRRDVVRVLEWLNSSRVDPDR